MKTQTLTTLLGAFFCLQSSFADDYKMLDKVPPLNIGAVNSINFYGKE